MQKVINGILTIIIIDQHHRIFEWLGWIYSRSIFYILEILAFANDLFSTLVLHWMVIPLQWKIIKGNRSCLFQSTKHLMQIIDFAISILYFSFWIFFLQIIGFTFILLLFDEKYQMSYLILLEKNQNCINLLSSLRSQSYLVVVFHGRITTDVAKQNLKVSKRDE